MIKKLIIYILLGLLSIESCTESQKECTEGIAKDTILDYKLRSNLDIQHYRNLSPDSIEKQISVLIHLIQEYNPGNIDSSNRILNDFWYSYGAIIPKNHLIGMDYSSIPNTYASNRVQLLYLLDAMYKREIPDSINPCYIANVTTNKIISQDIIGDSIGKGIGRYEEDAELTKIRNIYLKWYETKMYLRTNKSPLDGTSYKWFCSNSVEK